MGWRSLLASLARRLHPKKRQSQGWLPHADWPASEIEKMSRAAVLAGLSSEPPDLRMDLKLDTLSAACAEQFEAELRNAFAVLRFEPGRTLEMSEIASGERSAGWPGLAHWSGYARERSLLSLEKKISAPIVFSIFLRRLNDWVPQVRHAAMSILPAVATETSASVVAESFFVLFPRMLSWKRWGDAVPVEVVSLLGDPDIFTGFSERIATRSGGEPLRALLAAAPSPAVDAHLPRFAASARAPAVRSVATRWLLDGQTSWSDGEEKAWINKALGEFHFRPVIRQRSISPEVIDTRVVCSQAARDKAVQVRREAGSYLLSRRGHLEGWERELAKELLDDPYPSVVERARFALKPDENK